ncbi:hypothetical protein J2Z33_002760 [Rubellimicrobium aerolatum]|nr:hypothetical protein [Rubellimicrobium aerolatum]
MSLRLTLLVVLLGLAALGLAGCEPTSGPTATCFSLVEGPGPCEFRPLPEDLDEDA